MPDNEFTPDLLEQTLSWPDLRGEGAVEARCLVNDDQDVGIFHKKHLADFITKFGLQQIDSVIPSSYNRIHSIATSVLSGWFYWDDRTDPDSFGLESDAVEEGVRAAVDGGYYDPDDLTMWRPTRVGHDGQEEAIYPFVITTDTPPDAWLINRELGSREEFMAEFGVQECDHCGNAEDEPFAECPNCDSTPSDVEDVLDIMREAHPGVMVFMASEHAGAETRNELQRYQGPDIEDVIEDYKDATGDKLLEDEDALEEWIDTHGPEPA